MKGFVDEKLRALLLVPLSAASDSEYPLLGTTLRDERHLNIDYKTKSVELT